MTVAMIFRYQRIGSAVKVLVLATRRQQTDRVIATRRRPVLVDAAAFLGDKLALVGALFGLVLDAADTVPGELEGLGVLPEEFGRGNAQTLLEPQDVVRRQHDIDILAAGIEAVDILVAAELDNRTALELGRDYRRIRNR